MLIDLRTEGLNIYFLCPFIGCFCLIGASFASGQSIFGKFPFLQNILISVSEILALLPYLISKKIQNDSFMKTEKSKEKENIEKNELMFDEYEEKNSQIQLYQPAILGFTDFLGSFLLYLGNDLFNKDKFKFYFMSSNILFLTILQKYILKTRIYRHQIASFILFLAFDIGYIILLLFDDLLNYNAFQLIFIFFSNICFSFEITYEKKILNKSFISFYKLCVYLGISTLILNIIASTITTIIDYNIDVDDNDKIYLFNYRNYLDQVDDHVLIEIILVFVFVILNGVYNILQFLTIKYLSPNHVLITHVMLAVYYSILIKFQDIEIKSLTFVLSIVFHIICFFALFIFLEIIQLNFCGINKDTNFKMGLRTEVDKYMKSFSSIDDETNSEILIDEESKKELNKTASSTDELGSYSND